MIDISLNEGDQENVHELDNKRLKDRGVVRIDIANDVVNAADYKKDEDPKLFKSEKTGRGPLSGEWRVRPEESHRNTLNVSFSSEHRGASNDGLQACDDPV